jgi:nucleotide-binding universal stress UspA family protein
MFEHVLVPLDSSALSESALPYALQILAPQGKLTLLTIIEAIHENVFYHIEGGTAATAYAPARQAAQNDLYRQAEEYLGRVASQLELLPPALELMIQIGRPADVIVDVATSSDVKTIVMSTRGHTGLSRWLLGSVTQKVLHAAPCPVLIIPSKGESDQTET